MFITFMVICWFAFLIGVIIVHAIRGKFGLSEKGWSPNYLRKFTLSTLVLGFAAVLLNLITIYTFIQAFGFTEMIYNILGVEKIANSRLLVAQLLANNRLGWVETFNFCIIIAMFWLIWVERRVLSKTTLIFLYSANLILILTTIFKSLVVQTRGPILSLVLGILAVWIYNQWRLGKLKTFRILNTVVIFTLFSTSLFGVLQYYRDGGNNVVNATLKGLVGYFPASYNRGAAIIDNRLEYPNAGSLYNILEWFWNFPLLSNTLNFIDIGRSLGLNLPINSFVSQNDMFVNVGQQGFNSGLIWSTIYGSVFTDIQWLTPLWFVLYGIVAEMFWVLFRRKNLFGIIIYPRIMVGLVFWYAVSDISRRDTAVAVLTALTLWFCIKIVDALKLKRLRAQ